jgi:ketosteroid isomerase-like protein
MPTGPGDATAAETFEKFIAAINSRNLKILTSLMTADHLFVDSPGNRLEGSRIDAGRLARVFCNVPRLSDHDQQSSLGCRHSYSDGRGRRHD